MYYSGQPHVQQRRAPAYQNMPDNMVGASAGGGADTWAACEAPPAAQYAAMPPQLNLAKVWWEARVLQHPQPS